MAYHAVHNLSTFTNAQSANSITIEANFPELPRAFLPQIIEHAALNDAEERLPISPEGSMASPRPFRGQSS